MQSFSLFSHFNNLFLHLFSPRPAAAVFNFSLVRSVLALAHLISVRIFRFHCFSVCVFLLVAGASLSRNFSHLRTHFKFDSIELRAFRAREQIAIDRFSACSGAPRRFFPIHFEPREKPKQRTFRFSERVFSANRAQRRRGRDKKSRRTEDKGN